MGLVSAGIDISTSTVLGAGRERAHSFVRVAGAIVYSSVLTESACDLATTVVN